MFAFVEQLRGTMVSNIRTAFYPVQLKLQVTDTSEDNIELALQAISIR